MENINILVEPLGRKLTVEKGSNLLEILNSSNIYLESTCGGHGTCGKCKIRVLDGEIAPSDSDLKKLTEEEIATGYRLACKVEVEKDIVIEITDVMKEDADRKSSTSKLTGIELKTSFKKEYLELPKPVLQEDQIGDLERIKRELPNGENYNITLDALRKLPEAIRKEKFKITVTIYKDTIIDVEPGNTLQELYGVAFDIGSTSIVGTLVDLNTGDAKAVFSTGNPQRSYGADVISRITYASEPGGVETLRSKVVEGMNDIIDNLCKKAEIGIFNIYHVATVGNTTMHHLFLGIDPSYLARSPYIPAFHEAQILSAKEIGLDVNPSARVFVVPNIAGYVGADTIGVVLDTKMETDSQIKLAIDIGTNGEVLLGSKEKLLSCSTAAGPAFEGASIKYGMRAAEGAIEKVQIDTECTVETIGNKPAVGICGSGLLDAVAQLVKVGVIDEGGRILPPELIKGVSPKILERVVKGEHGYDFILIQEEKSGIDGPILLTQKDVRELQLAKGAIYAGVHIMMKELNIKKEDIAEIILAGAFGSYIDKESALLIGLVPAIEIDKIKSIGNAAGRGAQMVLMSDTEKLRSIDISNMVKYIELSSSQDFQMEFMSAINFPSPN